MKKTLTLGILALAFLFFTSLPAFSWGSATHAYIASRIGKILPLMNANEMYGCMAPDIFTYAFDLLTDQEKAGYIALFTHGVSGAPGGESFMEVWKKASWWGFQKSLAYGYVAHNDVWGIDSTAHHHGVKVGTDEGYVIYKAKLLLDKIIDIEGLPSRSLSDVFTMIGIDDPNVQLELAHNLFETAGDIYLAQKDKLIGEKIIGAALLRSNDLPALLTKVMGNDWKDPIYAAEKEFRKSMVLYGQVLMQDQETAIKNLAEQMAQLGMAYLQAMGVTLPPYIDLDMVTILAEKVIRAALPLCSDYMTEVNATISFVKNNLQAHGVWY